MEISCTQYFNCKSTSSHKSRADNFLLHSTPALPTAAAVASYARPFICPFCNHTLHNKSTQDLLDSSPATAAASVLRVRHTELAEFQCNYYYVLQVVLHLQTCARAHLAVNRNKHTIHLTMLGCALLLVSACALLVPVDYTQHVHF